MSAQFKKGDRVRVVAPDEQDKNAGLKLGGVGTVVEESSDGPLVMFDGFDPPEWHLHEKLGAWWMLDDQLELVEDEKSPEAMTEPTIYGRIDVTRAGMRVSVDLPAITDLPSGLYVLVRLEDVRS